MSKPDKKKPASAADKELDKFALYSASVQDPKAELQNLSRIYKELIGHEPRVLREDFCATFLNCCAWVELHPQNRAVGVDMDAIPLDYGRRHHLARLDQAAQERITLIQANVIDVREPKVDLIAISNFSVNYIKQRQTLLHYFKQCYAALNGPGMLSVDLLGGTGLSQPNIEKRTMKLPDGTKFKYGFEQESYNAITHEAIFHIHFKIKGGPRLKRAFSYDWRIWSIPEIRDLMREAGFSKTYCYWEGDDGEGGGNGIYTNRHYGEDCETWLCYVAGVNTP